MTIPDFQTVMLPLLQLASDGKEHILREAGERLAIEFNLSEEEKSQLLPSGRQPIFYNRVSWAKVYLQQAGLLLSPRRGCFQISEKGQQVLANKPERINIKFLETFPEFVESRSSSKRERDKIAERETDDDHATPEEKLEDAYQRIRNGLASEILNHIKGCSAQFFERLVVELLDAQRFKNSLAPCTESAPEKAFSLRQAISLARRLITFRELTLKSC